MTLTGLNINNAPEEKHLVLTERPAVPFYCQTIPVSQYRFYLTDEIEEPDKYHQMCQVMRQAGERDQIFIHINSEGGRIDSTVQIIAAMKESKADVVTVADGIVASAATLLFLAGDGFIVNPHCLFMIHNFSGGAYGKGHELEAQIHADVRWFTRVANDYYEAFLSKAEIKKVFKGEDYWFTADEVTTRIETRIAHLRRKGVDAQKAESKVRFEHLKNDMMPYLDERQAKQMEKLITCAITKVEAQQQEADENAQG